MRPRPFLLLLAGFALVLMAAGKADAEEPLWKYTAETDLAVQSVTMSANGDYIVGYATGNFFGLENEMYLFDSYSSTPLWNYTASSLAISKIF